MARTTVRPYRPLRRAEEVAAIGQLWTTTLAVACLASGLACLIMAVARIGGVASQLVHGAMGLAMAGMLSPWGDPMPAWAGAAAFAVSGAWFASVALGRGRDRADARHLTIASAAMVLMYLAGAHSAAPDAPGAHAAHGGPAGGGGLPAVLVVGLSLVLAAYFVWHAWTCAERARPPTGPASTVAVCSRVTTSAGPVAHGVMSALMAAMFLGVT